MDIVFPEYKNPIITRAISTFNSQNQNTKITSIKAESLIEGFSILENYPTSKKVAMITGIDYTTRDIALAAKCHLGLAPRTKTFSSCIVMRPPKVKPKNLPSGDIIISDAGITKHPSEEQLYDIVFQTYKTAQKILPAPPKIAMLSFSTFGSARDSSIDRINHVIKKIHKNHPGILIDGEMQLDCAVNDIVAKKKISDKSPVAGHANVLIVSDLNAGNILYKALEQFAGYTAAGPILQGFSKPVSDLSRGSTVKDVILTIETLIKLAS